MDGSRGSGPVFLSRPRSEDSIDQKLVRIERKLDQLLEKLEGEKEGSESLLGSIYDNFKYPFLYIQGSISSLRGDDGDGEGSFARL